MPLTRYQIRNEYGLADPELYTAADKDDPEALLEGVAMAGLVGVLHQLGDLAEFAAEVFHDLHEEVMTTAARGHGLVARVQQLEAEVPSIERAFLSQTNHSPFFSSTGVDWHPNLCMEQNLVTRGDLPRFVMDSYEECSGPPRLFLLDKFDVAGAGACLKRYTDPSFFKVEAASSGIATVEVQREKKIRKVKKKGSRWKNGETAEVVPTSHAKLHELFLEERVKNGHSDPACLVKLKRRQLNGSVFDLKPGKSYMEKFLLPASPKRKLVWEASVPPSPLKLSLDSSSESGLEIVEIGTVSPVKKSSQGNERTCLSPKGQELELKPFTDELNGEINDKGTLQVPDSIADGETDEAPSMVQKLTIEEELTVDADGKAEGSLDGDHSDVASEVDNYMDALTTMDSEMEAENEYKPKRNQVLLNVDKFGLDSDANEEQLEVQANFSDSQSIGNSSLSDDGNSSCKKGRYSVSYSDSLSNLAENTPSDGEGEAKMSPSTENCVAETGDLPSDHPSICVEALGSESLELVVFPDTYSKEDKIHDLEEAPCSPCLMDWNPTLVPSVTPPNSLVVSLAGCELDETSFDFKPSSESLSTDKNRTNLVHSSVVLSDITSLTRYDTSFTAASESSPVDAMDHADPIVFADASVDTSNLPVLVREKKGSEDSLTEMLETDRGGEMCAKNFVEGKFGSPHSIVSSTMEQLPCSALPEVEVDSSATLLPNSSDILKPGGLVSEVNDAIVVTEVYPENLTSVMDTSEVGSITEHQCSDISVTASQVELNSAELGMKLEELSGTADNEEMGALNGKVDLVRGEGVPVEHPSNSSDKLDLKDHLSLDNIASGAVLAKEVAASATVTVGDDDIVVNDATYMSSDAIVSQSRNLSDIPESLSGSEDVHQKRSELNDVTSLDWLAESMAQMEIKQLEVVSRDLDLDPCKSVSADHTNVEVGEYRNDSSLAEQTQSSLYVSDVTAAPSSALSNQELESKSTCQCHSVESTEDSVYSPTCYRPESETPSKLSTMKHDQISAESVHADDANSVSLNLPTASTCDVSVIDVTAAPSPALSNQGLESKSTCQCHSAESTEDSVCSPTCYRPESETSSKLSMMKHGQISAESVHADDANSVFLNLQTSSTYDLAGHGVPSEESLQIQSDQLDKGYIKADEASLKSSDPLDTSSKQEIPSQEPLVQSTGLEPNATELLMNPFDSVFPSFGLLPEVNHVNLEALPPLPPLPPMQWRIGKAQPAPVPSQGDLTRHSWYTYPPLCTANEKAQFDLTSSGETIVQPSNPFSSLTVADSQNSPYSSAESVATMQPPLSSEMPTMHDASRKLDCLPLEPTQSPDSFLTLPEIPIERLAHGFSASGDDSTHSSSNPFSPAPTVGHMSSERPLPSKGLTIQSFNQLAPETSLDTRLTEHASQNSEGERGNFPDKSVAQLTLAEEHSQQDSVTSQEETTWSLTTLALPPTYEIGKPNGNKLPRPRNPLIDAVAGHDKSKLRKVTERVRSQIGSKVDERDSLLEQIRTKSFNLRPAVVTRPSIQGIQGPRANLKVAAILEKANAIRQALAGSDEDDDSDNWSDS